MTQPDDNRVVGRVPFVDGVLRDVYEDGDGRRSRWKCLAIGGLRR
jgi:hypothetical protein